MESLKNFRNAITMDPYYLPVVYDLVRIYVKMRNIDSAIQIIENNIKRYPREGGLYAESGHTYFASGDYFPAIRNYEKAIELGQRGNELLKRLAISYYSTQAYEKSRETFEILIKKDTSDYKICLYLGHIYNILGNGDKGLSFLTRSFNLLLPDSMTITTIYSGMVNSYQLLRKYDEQIKMLHMRQENTPENYRSPKYLEEIAEIYDKSLKNKLKALEYYNDYYLQIKDIEWLSKETKDQVLKKINRLRSETKTVK
jgi:tetratricopeptide (TPR) repeat protein